jgi:hypothetical protein
MSGVLSRAERREVREVMRDTAPVVDEYEEPGVLLERFERGPLVPPSHNALMAQAQMITEAAREAKVLGEDESWRALARARRRRGGDVVARARNRQGAFARIGRR